MGIHIMTGLYYLDCVWSPFPFGDALESLIVGLKYCVVPSHDVFKHVIAKHLLWES